MSDTLPDIVIPIDFNYIAVFMTFSCQLRCTYCLSGDTLIMTPTGQKLISEIKVGDEVIGFEEDPPSKKHRQLSITKVTETFSRIAETIRISTENSYLDVTKEHPILTERGWKPAGKVTTANDLLMVMPPFGMEIPPIDNNFMLGYLKGVIEGDGCFRIAHPFSKLNRAKTELLHYVQYSMSLRMWDDEPLYRAQYYAQELLGLNLKLSEHRLAISTRDEVLKLHEQINYRRPLAEYECVTESMAAGYLSGIFDAEGGFHQNLRISNQKRVILDSIKHAYDILGFKCKEENFKGANAANIILHGGFAEQVRFFWVCRPSITRKANDLFKRVIRGREKIKSIEPKTTETVYNFETGTHTYVANGFAVHNCINHHGGDLVKGRRLDPKDWIRGLNRIVARTDLPITLQGGEPTAYKGFYEVVNGLREDIPLDLLTNLEVSVDTFSNQIRSERFNRSAPYASIRVSYHHGQSDYNTLTQRVLQLQNLGYSIGIWEVDHPDYHGQVIFRQQKAHSMGIDYRLKEFLGPHKGEVYGTMRYPDAVNSHDLRTVNCRTSELLISPDGSVFRCHSDLYANRFPIGNILDPVFNGNDLGHWRFCDVYGKCNSCDIKTKTNRFQEYGHSSVEIKDISAPYAKNNEYVHEVVNTYGKQDAKH